MKAFGKAFATTAILFAGVMALAPSPGASSEHFVITNNGNLDSAQTGTILKLEGTRANPLLKPLRLLKTGGTGTGGVVEPTIQVIRNGSDICAFLSFSDYMTGTNEIAAFIYPSMKLVGNFSDPNVPGASAGIALSARGGYLYAGYGGSEISNLIGTWQINSGCRLTLVNTVTLPMALVSMDVTPDGKTLLVSDIVLYVDSFSIGPGGTLTEHGPYAIEGLSASGIDVTTDSNVAFFSVQGYGPPDDQYTDIAVYPIEADGSLGVGTNFGGDGSLGMGYGGGWVWLSPDEKFLFSVDTHWNVTTLFFIEGNPERLGYSCLTTLKLPDGAPYMYVGPPETALRSGPGGAIYAPEEYSNVTIGVLSINPSTGCTTEVPGSPFPGGGAAGTSVALAAWPPRPF